MKTVQIVTHDGIFHADELFALAVLKIFFEGKGDLLQITRTRDEEKVSVSDIAVDIGGEYDKAKNRFDHHQKGRAGIRENEIPYASFGLIWKHFGKSITPNLDVWKAIERKLVTPIDALDNGISLSTPIYEGISEYTNAHIISAINNAYPSDQTDLAFAKALEFTHLVLVGEIKKAQAKIEGEAIVTKEIIEQGEPEILVLEKYVTWDNAVSKYKNIKLVVFNDTFADRWCIQAARDSMESFGKDRISFPKEWRGLSTNELEVASGVADSVFCHVGGFFAVTKTKNSAIEMAKKVIDSQKK